MQMRLLLISFAGSLPTVVYTVAYVGFSISKMSPFSARSRGVVTTNRIGVTNHPRGEIKSEKKEDE